MKKVNSQKPTITVVIPAYNEEKYLPRTLKSLKEQTVVPFEIIVSDNNSTDNTSRIARDYGARVVKETKKGYVFAVQKGFSEAKGDIVALTDSDTQLPSTWCERLLELFEDESVAAVGGSITYKDAGFFGNLLTFPAYTAFMYLHFTLGKPHLTGSTLAVRRSVLEKIGGVNTRYEIGADVELGLRAKRFGKVLFDPKLTVTTSSRRWQENKSEQFMKYAHAYLHTVWLNRPPKGSLQVIR